MSKILIASFLFTIAFYSQCFCQKDSTWNVSSTARFVSESVATTGLPFTVLSIEGQFDKNSHTFVPGIGYKSIHKLTGNQIGLAYYKKWNWGYSHLGMYFGSNPVYPTMVLRSNIHCNVGESLEANAGFSSISFADGNTLSIISIGSTFYFRSVMTSYIFKLPISGFLFQRLILRKYLNTPKDHLQISISHGLDNEGLIQGISVPMNVISAQFSLHKKILHKTQLQVSFGLTNASNEDNSNKLFTYSIGIKRDI